MSKPCIFKFNRAEPQYRDDSMIKGIQRNMLVEERFPDDTPLLIYHMIQDRKNISVLVEEKRE